MKRLVLSGLVLGLAGCHTAVLPPPSQYSLAPAVAPLALRFARGGAGLSDGQVESLHIMARQIPATGIVAFATSGEPARRRAEHVAHIMQRNLRLVYQASVPMDEAVVSMPASGFVTADACRGRAEAEPEDFWPGDDSSLGRLLPPGCSTAMTIAAQTTAPGDLIIGRPLPPGAALPYAQAVERYYRRNDEARKSEQAEQNGAGEGSSQAASAGAAPAGAAASAPAGNPLLGNVPQQAPAQGQ